MVLVKAVVTIIKKVPVIAIAREVRIASANKIMQQ